MPPFPTTPLSHSLTSHRLSYRSYPQRTLSALSCRCHPTSTISLVSYTVRTPACNSFECCSHSTAPIAAHTAHPSTGSQTPYMPFQFSVALSGSPLYSRLRNAPNRTYLSGRTTNLSDSCNTLPYSVLQSASTVRYSAFRAYSCP